MAAVSERVRLHVLPADSWVEVAKGDTILEALMGAGFPIESLCGGRGLCHRCKVIAPGLQVTPKHAELETFSPQELAAGYHLACLWKLQDDLEVEIVPLEDFADKAFSGIESWPAIEVAPNVRRWGAHLDPPSLEDQRSDARRIEDSVPAGEAPVVVGYDVVVDLAQVVRKARWRVSVTCVDDKVIEVERQHLRSAVGLAIDVGTTSVAGMLVDLRTGSAADVAAHSNSQGLHGAEVMSRIEFSSTPGGTETLQKEVIGDINRIIDECCERTAVHPEDIVAVTVVGNTTMVHLFLGLPTEHIGAAPFVGVTNEAVIVEAGRLGLHTHPRAQVYVLPTVAGFVGADTVGAILATRLDETASTQVMMDIGTNGEIALAHRGELYTASAPAGPAFEGGEIQDGMRAATGAIDTVAISEQGQLTYTTIGNVPPQGICGSALVDLCAELVRVGIIDASGKLLDAEEVAKTGASPAICELARRVGSRDGRREILVAGPEESATGRPIVLTQPDIRQYQLVKSAISSGVAILLGDVGLAPSALEDVFLAGSFGSHINLDSARRTGLVPELASERLHYVGNAALEGARMALLNPMYRARAEAVAARAHHVELSARPDFNERFLEGLAFGPTRRTARRSHRASTHRAEPTP
jgi:uncharacterized 2Fe-2S/4Fe-4S cluster protein (DUF4445 family)